MGFLCVDRVPVRQAAGWYAVCASAQTALVRLLVFGAHPVPIFYQEEIKLALKTMFSGSNALFQTWHRN